MNFQEKEGKRLSVEAYKKIDREIKKYDMMCIALQHYYQEII